MNKISTLVAAGSMMAISSVPSSADDLFTENTNLMQQEVSVFQVISKELHINLPSFGINLVLPPDEVIASRFDPSIQQNETIKCTLPSEVQKDIIKETMLEIARQLKVPLDIDKNNIISEDNLLQFFKTLSKAEQNKESMEKNIISFISESGEKRIQTCLDGIAEEQQREDA